jgi:RecB family exonuclease
MSDLVRLRASGLAELFDCPARWEAKHLKGMTLPASAAAALGTAVHASTSAFDSSRLPGGYAVSADDSAQALVDAIWRPQEDVDWGDTQPKQAEAVGLALHARYCATIGSARQYVGVEVKCTSVEIPELGIELTGQADRVRKTDDGLLGISDLKTGINAVSPQGVAKSGKHVLQFGVYEILAEHELGVPMRAPAEVIGMQTGKTPVTQRVATGYIADARSVLVGTDERPGMLQHAGEILKAGRFYGNPASILCGPKYCPAYPTCPYRA